MRINMSCCDSQYSFVIMSSFVLCVTPFYITQTHHHMHISITSSLKLYGILFYLSPNRYSREFTSHSMSNCTVLTEQHVDVHTLNLVVRLIYSVPYTRYIQKCPI